MKVYKSHFSEKESDITIISESKNAIKRAKNSFFQHRKELEKFIEENDQFLKSFSPVNVLTDLKIINKMAEVAWVCDVGPMAAVAGALADLMLESMKNLHPDDKSSISPVKVALVENGGEIIVDSIKPMKIALFAGNNELNLNLGFLIEKKDCPIGIGTSSATVGHAFSFGQADAVTIFARDASLADAAATRVANAVKGIDIEASIKKGLDITDDIDGVYGAFISREDKVGHTGKIPKLIKREGDRNKIIIDKVDASSFNSDEVFN
ncbi:MAG: UPF0280 family protein [Promethearchaeota archaeon]